MIKQIVELQLRGIDEGGDGAYGASRDGGARVHNGVDYECVPGGVVLSPIVGKVTKIGFPYGDDLSWTYIEIQSGLLFHRLFYVTPHELLLEGDDVAMGMDIGIAQDISQRYPKCKPHIHYEIMDQAGNYLDPNEL